jgi:hypothetical protein
MTSDRAAEIIRSAVVDKRKLDEMRASLAMFASGDPSARIAEESLSLIREKGACSRSTSRSISSV